MIDRKILDEDFIDIETLVEDNNFEIFGVADIGIKEISKKNNYGVITADLGLYLELSKSNVNCINFTYYMEINER
ncbi:MAG: hypothetical protein LBC39_01135 [Methanobrevibacter sp.]|nr:hypothetical protein [Candidatus Methanovirga aequatorialis]